MKSKIDSIYIRHDDERICQGDIIRDFEYVDYASVVGGKIKIWKRIIPYLIVLTQDCDLEWDYTNHAEQKDNQDKFLHSILVCPAYHAEKLRKGTHLEGLGLKMRRINSDRWNLVKKHNNARYHYLEDNKELQIPELVLDFKHYYTVPRDLFYEEAKEHYIGTINELFRESLSQRFTHYLSRIGLPPIINEEDGKGQ